MDIDPHALNASLRRLLARSERVADDDLLGALQEVVDACVDLFQVTGSGIMLADEQNMVHYVAASDGQGRLLEKAESETKQGPCTDAFVHDRVVDSPDLHGDERWQRLRDALAGQDELRAVMGVPVKLGAITVGTLDVFRDQPHEWTDAERDALHRYAGVVQATLTSALAAHTAGEQAAQLQYALDYRVVIERGVGFLMAREGLDYRVVIERGVGFLMAREGLDAVAAFDKLRTAARSSRTKIGQVAEQLLETGELP